MWAATLHQVLGYRVLDPGGSVRCRLVSFESHCDWWKTQDFGSDPASACRKQQNRWVTGLIGSVTLFPAWYDDWWASWSCRSQSGFGLLWTGHCRKHRQAVRPLSHSTCKKKTYALELLPKYVMFSVLLDFSKHGTMVSTACPPVLVGAGCGRHCNLWYRCRIFRKGKVLLNNDLYSNMQSFHNLNLQSNVYVSDPDGMERRLQGFQQSGGGEVLLHVQMCIDVIVGLQSEA